MKAVTLALTCLLFTTVAAAQQFATQFHLDEVVPGISVIAGVDGGVGGNMAVIASDDRVAMIDDGYPVPAPLLLKYIEDSVGRPVDFVINTHVHGDHVGGNAHFAESGAIIFAHERIRSRLLEDSAPAGGDGGLPVVTFPTGISIHFAGLEARVTHVQGAHTDGDAFIHFPGVNVVHTGDLFFNSLFPFIDLDRGGTVDGFITAQEQLLALVDEETRIIPGHGEVTGRASLAADLAMLKDARSRVLEQLAQGLSEDEIVAANPLAEYHDEYDWAFITTERMTRTLVRDLSR